MIAQKKVQSLLAQRLSNGPSIIVIRGVAYVTLGGRTSLLTKVGLTSQKHGFVSLLYAEESWGVLYHTTASGRGQHVLFVPPKKRINVSNGHFQLLEVNYDSFVYAHDQGTMLTPVCGNTKTNRVIAVGEVCGTTGDHSVLIYVLRGGMEEMRIPGGFKEMLDFYLANCRKKAYKIVCAKCPDTFWSLVDPRKLPSSSLLCIKCSKAT